jgi:hypothetical protein
MSIDERLEALAMNLELMGHDLETLRAKSVEDGENIRALLATARQDGENIRALARIADGSATSKANAGLSPGV